MKNKIFFNSLTNSDGIETSDNSISNVAIMTTGEALGHGLNIDRRSLETALECIGGGKLKSYVNHNWNPDPTDILGVFSDFEIVDLEDGNSKLIAHKFEFLASADAEDKARILELSKVAPEVFGCSLTTECAPVWIMEDGSEVCACERPKNCRADAPVARFSRVLSCDFVSEPAANPSGLFSSTPKGTNKQSKTESKRKMKNHINYFNSRFAGQPALFQQAVSKLASFAEGDEIDEKKIGDEVEGEAKIEAIKKENEELKAENEELKAKLEESEKAKSEAEAEKAELSAKIQSVSGAENFSIESESSSADISAEVAEWNKQMDLAQAKGDVVEIQRLSAIAQEKKYF